MIRYIRADLRRCLRKKGFYGLILFLMLITSVGGLEENAVDQIEKMKGVAGGFVLILASIGIFINVYGDEWRAGTMITVIGRGLSRGKVIIAKLISTTVLLVIALGFCYPVAVFINVAVDIGVTPRQNFFLFIYYIYVLIRGIGYFAFTSMVLFSSWSVATGMVTLMFLTALAKLILQGVQENMHLPVYDIYLDGLMEQSYNAFVVGGVGWQIIPAVIFILGAIYISIRLFERKELDL